MTSPRKRLRKFHVGGQLWTVAVVPRTDPRLQDDDGGTLDGCALYTECLIVIADDLTMEAREEAFLHELEHAINIVSGARHEMCLRLRSERARAEHEERIVRARTPLMHRVLVDLGFRFPKGLLT